LKMLPTTQGTFIDPQDPSIRIGYGVLGTGSNKVVLIQGFCTVGAQWKFQSEYIAKSGNYQVAYFDARGVGESSTPTLNRKYTTSLFANDVVNLMNHLGWTKSHIVGASMGGMVATEIALLIPDRVVSLSLITTHAGMAMIPPGTLKLWASMLIPDHEKRSKYFLEALYGSATLKNKEKIEWLVNFHTQMYKAYRQPQILACLGHFNTLFGHYVRYDRLLYIRHRRIPTLVVTGTQDNLVYTTHSDMLSHVLDAKLVVLDGAGHGVLIERPDELNVALTEFIQSIDSTLSPRASKASSNNNLSHRAGKSSKTDGTKASSLPSSLEWDRHILSAIERRCKHLPPCTVRAMAKTFQTYMLLFFLRLIIMFVSNSFTIRNSIPPILLDPTLYTFLTLLTGIYYSYSCVIHGIYGWYYGRFCFNPPINNKSEKKEFKIVCGLTFPWPVLVYSIIITALLTRLYIPTFS